MQDRALAHTRTMHERYNGAKRNPWNEVEWGDHYSRSMASYGVFTAVCGFEYNGPKGYIAFSPRITPENFKAAFTSAAGWGTFSQNRSARTQAECLRVRRGELTVKTMAFDLPVGRTPNNVKVNVDGRRLEATYRMRGNRVIVTLADATKVSTDQDMAVEINW